jgi:indolepyruvate ferredoxin oxidoreductase, beta subunit
MPNNHEITNVVFAGLGGLGVLRASDILADAVFRAGHDVKKSEIHGMSQRGGSVSSDVRYGPVVFSPMVPDGEADYLVVLHPTQIENNRHVLRPVGILLSTALLPGVTDDLTVLEKDHGIPLTQRNFNVGLLGALSVYLDIPRDLWLEAIRDNLPEKVYTQNVEAFDFGMTLVKK